MIICAAVKLTMNDEAETEMIICGHRHGNCFATITQLNILWDGCKKVQGFINHKGEFLNRKEALIHAVECGQLSETHKYYQEDHNINELYSEDLY